MDKKKHFKSLKEREEITSLPKEELQNLRGKLTIEISKEDFDELVKAMLKNNNNQ